MRLAKLTGLEIEKLEAGAHGSARPMIKELRAHSRVDASAA